MKPLIRDQPGSYSPGRRPAWILFSALAFSWLIFQYVAAPQIGGVDAFIFRDAGCACASGQGFTALSVPHNQMPHRELFASYTPGAPLLFTVPAKLFGCYPYTDSFYNIFWGLLASALLLHIAILAISHPGPRMLAALVLGLVLPTGLLTTDYDRPEAPAFCLILILLLAWARFHSLIVRILLLGAMGFVFLIHPFGGIAGFSVLLFLLICERPRNTLSSQILTGAAGSALFGVVVAACAAWLQHLDSTAIHRFLGHAVGQGTGAGAILHPKTAAHPSLLSGYEVALQHVFNMQELLLGAPIISMLLSLVVLSAYAMAYKLTLRTFMQLVALASILFLLPAAFFLAQPNYFALTRGLLFATIALGSFSLARQLRAGSALIVLVLIAFVFSAPGIVVQVLLGIETRASYRLELMQASRIRNYFASHGIAHPRLLVDPVHYFIYKPFFPRLYSIQYLQPGTETSSLRFDGLMLCYDATRSFSHAALEWPQELNRSDWKLIESQSDPVHITFFGKPVMRSNWSWTCDAYQHQP